MYDHFLRILQIALVVFGIVLLVIGIYVFLFKNLQLGLSATVVGAIAVFLSKQFKTQQ
jgi:uncharacterized membrane protein HdeD (DUF308 family)